MSKKFIVGPMTALIAVGVYVSTNNSSKSVELSDLNLANVEALTQVENPCNNYNGYRRILEGDEKIYDCCFKEQIGKGKEDCKRW